MQQNIISNVYNTVSYWGSWFLGRQQPQSLPATGDNEEGNKSKWVGKEITKYENHSEEDKMYDFINESMSTLLIDPYNSEQHIIEMRDDKLVIKQVNATTTEGIYDIIGYNDGVIQNFLKSLDPNHRFRFFTAYRNWSFLAELFYYKSSKTKDFNDNITISSLFKKLKKYLDIKNSNSFVKFFIERRNDLYIDFLLHRTFLVFIELFDNDSSEDIQQFIEKIKLYLKTSEELKQKQEKIPFELFDSSYVDMIKSLIFIQKSIIYREISIILSNIKNNKEINSLKKIYK